MGHTTVHAAEGGVHSRHSISTWFGFPDSSVGKESACNAGSGRSAGKGIGYPLQYSWAYLVAQLIKNPPAMWETWFDPWVGKVPWRRETLPIPVFWPGEFHGLSGPWGSKSRTQLSDFHSLSGKEPACQCRRLRRRRFDPWVGKIPCSRKWQLTSVFLPVKFHGQRSLAGYSPWGGRVGHD